MDKYEYKLRSDEIVKLIEEEKYAEAVSIADTIDWRRVKSITMLLKVAALYRVNRRNEDSKAVLQLAYDRYPTNRSVVYSLCEVSIELDDVVAAIEYYKEFVKLAPRDNGVFTLRYRILEAQEASLEERIELLEELKKRDYQEEWAYELAYLYHRVGLATKCVEECDDLILWFGDGPYVMKAMELKMLHAPLTPIQQKKYDMAQAQQSEGNYTEDNYAGEEEYPQDDYAVEDSYADSNYVGEEEYPQDNYATEDGYGGGNYAEEGEYPQDNYTAEDRYGDGNYAEEGEYPQDNYTAEDSYGDGKYAEEGEYPQDNYTAEDGYGDGNYAEEGEYPQDNYTAEDSYADGNYAEESGYTQEIYTREDNEAQDNYGSTGSVGSVYHDTDSIDMSQYNTINLQKVVAESMKELFPDDEDIFAEEKTEISQPESIIQEETEAETSVEEIREAEPENVPVHTSRVAKMLTGVSEVQPEPNTGAISKVFVPGDDARAIKQDTDIETLRDTTEESVQEEHTRLEQNGENVYEEPPVLEQSVTEQPVPEQSEPEQSPDEEEVFQPMTGQMNLDEVLVEWEKMKQEKAREQKEEVRKLVLQQTGKIFENFDNSIKSGILGELEEEDSIVKEPVIQTQAILEETDDSEVEELTEIEETTETEELSQETAELNEIEEATEPESDYAAEECVQEVPEQEEIPEDAEEELYDQQEYIEDELMEEEGVIEDTQDESQPIPETQEIHMNTEEIGNLPDKIIEATDKETKGVKKEELREFTPEEQELFENFAVTKKIRKQIIFALDKMSLAAYTGNVIITGEAGLGTVRMAKNLIREYQAMDANFSGKVAKITGEKLNLRNLSEVFAKLGNGAIIIEKANGLTQDKLYEMSNLLNQDNLGLIVIMEDTRKEITHLLEKQAMIADYFNIRIDLMEMDNNALVAYAKNYALALEYSIDELGTLALYTRIANSQSGNHVVTKDEVRDIIDEAIWKSKKFNFKNFVDVLFAKRYDREDMIVLRERDFM